jgi:hypothetical protein
MVLHESPSSACLFRKKNWINTSPWKNCNEIQGINY